MNQHCNTPVLSTTINAILCILLLPLNDLAISAFSFQNYGCSINTAPLSAARSLVRHHNRISPLFSTDQEDEVIIGTATATVSADDAEMIAEILTAAPIQSSTQLMPEETATNSEPPSSFQKPLWMKCINAVVPPKIRALNEAVAMVANITRCQANELIEMGAVWAKMETLTHDDVLDQYYGPSSAANMNYADFPSGWGSGSENDELKNEQEEESLEEYVERMKNLRYRRILTPSTIEPGTDIRVYPHPRRFPSCYDFADPNRKLYEDTTFVIVDKPPLLPTQPDASNYEECCPGCVNLLMGPFQTIGGEDVHRPLICHRVDSCVGGCVVLSKDGNGQKVFSDLQRQRKIKKLYLAVTKEPVPLGMHVHWMWGELNARGQQGGTPCQFVSHTPPASRKKAKAWIRCVLEVVKSEPIIISKDNDYNYDPGQTQHYQSTVRLVTGRKHQVRAQLASLGCPLIRDTLYEPISGLTLESLEDEEMEDRMDEALSKVRVPTEAIGLQAHAILFAGVRAKARTPWWGNGEG